MSLTVASTYLDTSWIEFGVVAYTSGSISDEDDCITEIETKLNRGTLSTTSTPSSTEVKRWLRRAKQELVETKRFIWSRRYVTVALTSGTYRYSLPPDYGGGPINIRDKTNNNKIRVVSPHVFDTLYPDPAEETSGTILCACIKNTEIWFMPAPDGNDVIEFEYYRSGDDADQPPTERILSEDGFNYILLEDSTIMSAEGGGETYDIDMAWLPEIDRFRCCDYAIARSFASLHRWESALFYFKRWQEGLDKTIKSDGRRKLSESGYRARSVFQA